MAELDLLALKRGTVTAPAGCGKTQLIANCMGGHRGDKPVLILTHTNAGKSALETRLTKAKVPALWYRVSTIDSWCIRLISTFPKRSGHNRAIEMLSNPGTDYAAIRQAAWNLAASGDISDVLQATYSNLLVDEYQDCTLPQHNVIGWVANVLPTCVLGDPLQAIFGFREPTVHWDRDVYKLFPPAGELATPWRWNNAGAGRLGHWLLEARKLLLAGRPLDLRGAPAEVVWKPLPNDPNEAHQIRLEAARTKSAGGDGSVLVIGDSTNPTGQRQVASQTPGATTVEAVDLRDVTSFGRQFKPGEANALQHLLDFASDMMTGIGPAELLRRLDIIERGAARNEATLREEAALAFRRVPSFSSAQTLLRALEDAPNVRVFRPEALRVLHASLAHAAQGQCTFADAVVQARERNRHVGRPVLRRAVGSALLLKGLEADTAVILNPEGMDARHLYVALTRGARRLVVCSSGPLLKPAP